MFWLIIAHIIFKIKLDGSKSRETKNQIDSRGINKWERKKNIIFFAEFRLNKFVIDSFIIRVSESCHLVLDHAALKNYRDIYSKILFFVCFVLE